ncbi:ABC transporter permease [Roseisolibacter sp. H3M3-2]|uniref:ABC transporter permease n=1 Tax=Roseisolibacter sp. H3M3-2 TaxID=3031323 RepID=UPI0023DBB25E|nr:ABC transporter permease [Roseisolibacter sp. H3M3-2]MDF1503840.1 ABC transporter permease [Roseisolibacter sp. H3M3-2]
MNARVRVPLLFLGALALAAIVGPMLAHDPSAIGDVLATRLLPPGATDAAGQWHPLGTDRFGRDLLARTLAAARLSLAVGVAGSVLSGALGTALGAWAAWRGGAVDLTVTAVADALLAVPRIVLLLVVAALWGPGVGTTVGVLAATGWMGVARLVRAEALGVRRRDFVDGARALGASDARLLWRHVVPNALGAALVATSLGVGNAILLESGLSFLGLGIQPPAPSWGNLIAGGRELIVTAPWVALVPGVALVATVLACTLLGDAVRDRRAGESGTARLLAERA